LHHKGILFLTVMMTYEDTHLVWHGMTPKKQIDTSSIRVQMPYYTLQRLPTEIFRTAATIRSLCANGLLHHSAF